MTDEQIIKALECCFSNKSCEGCPLDTNDADSSCLRIIRNEAVHLCLRQQAEIERLQSLCASKDVIINEQEREISKLRARMQPSCESYKELTEVKDDD